MEVLNRQKALCMCVRLNGGEGSRVWNEKDRRTAAHGECWEEGASRSVMLGMHRRQGPGSV